jgi:hypothetical protein
MQSSILASVVPPNQILMYSYRFWLPKCSSMQNSRALAIAARSASVNAALAVDDANMSAATIKVRLMSFASIWQTCFSHAVVFAFDPALDVLAGVLHLQASLVIVLRSPSSRLAFSFVRDLLLRAKHLFIAAMNGNFLGGLPRIPMFCRLDIVRAVEDLASDWRRLDEHIEGPSMT